MLRVNIPKRKLGINVFEEKLVFEDRFPYTPSAYAQWLRARERKH